jgi:hypothetical protein
MNTLTVKAAPGVRVPVEDAPRRYIDELTAVTVNRTAYYQRQLMAGDLTEVQPSVAETIDKPLPVAPLK